MTRCEPFRARLAALATAAAALTAVALGAPGGALAQGAPAPASAPAALPDPALEARVNRLAAELRCLVCQNQSLADSHAELALDLKNQVRDQLAAGRSEGQVVEYMTDRYGDFVLYRPPLKATTVLLWAGPALLVLLGLALLWRTLGRAQREAGRDGEPGPTAEEAARANALLGRAGEDSAASR